MDADGLATAAHQQRPKPTPTPEHIPATKISVTINIDANIRFQINGLPSSISSNQKQVEQSDMKQHQPPGTRKTPKKTPSRPPQHSPEVRSRQTAPGNNTLPSSQSLTSCNCAMPVLPSRSRRPCPLPRSLQVQLCPHCCNNRTDDNTERRRKSSLCNTIACPTREVTL